jgi:hypothetical protein
MHNTYIHSYINSYGHTYVCKHTHTHTKYIYTTDFSELLFLSAISQVGPRPALPLNCALTGSVSMGTSHTQPYHTSHTHHQARVDYNVSAWCFVLWCVLIGLRLCGYLLSPFTRRFLGLHLITHVPRFWIEDDNENGNHGDNNCNAGEAGQRDVLARQPDEAADPVQWARRVQHKIRHLHLRRRLVRLQLQSPGHAVRGRGTLVEQGLVLCVLAVKTDSYSTLSAMCMLILRNQTRLNWPAGTFTDGFYETNYLDSVSCSWYPMIVCLV